MTHVEVDLRALGAEGPLHFMGIGGAGMCALAELLLRSGAPVSGCDLKDGTAMHGLARLGAEVHVGHDPGHVADASALVMTAAVPGDHPEVLAAREAEIPVLKRAEALGALVAHGTVIAVAGTHGKTTTTAMATEILAGAGRNPTGLAGGRVVGWKGNLRFGSDTLFVVEADEYDRSFLTLSPNVAVVTNVDADHLDVYSDFSEVRNGFAQFLEGLRDGGRAIVCADDYGAASLLPPLGSTGYTYGTSAGSMLRATGVSVTEREIRCTVYEEGTRVGDLVLPDGGRHTLLNALGASAAARTMDVEWGRILAALRTFSGVARRFERLGEVNGIVVIDDYAHHPTEIAATLETVRSLFPDMRLVAAFQPHLFTRTRDFAEDFGSVLAGADVVWVTDVFPAREAPIPGVSGETVADAVRAAAGAEVHYRVELGALADALADSARPGDVIVIMGAGSIETLGESVLSLLEARIHA